ncbi:MAG: AI-2E family transporter [Clostridia bacterium]|nr:AI-2E family transporter [Clostridia bacterium]
MTKKEFKEKFLLVFLGILTFFALKNFNAIWGNLCTFFNALLPFIYALLIAYIINWPYTFIRENFFDKVYKDNKKLSKILSMIAAYIFVIGILAFLIVIVAPQLILSFEHLINNISHYLGIAEVYTKRTLDFFNLDEEQLFNTIQNIFLAGNENLTVKIVNLAVNFIKNFAVIIYNWTIGIIASIYFLFNKEKLLHQAKKILRAFCSHKIYDAISYTMSLTCNCFGKFIIGKIIDGIIIGILCFIGTTALFIPYSVLISVIIGVTNIIPFFGPFLGAVPSIFILLIVDPTKALYFIIFIFILQQIDGNIIGPRILGNSIGISGVFIMVSVIVGGGLWGVPGMIFGVPIFAVAYSIMSKILNDKIKSAPQKDEI